MSKRTRIHPVQFYLNDDEQYILEEKYRLSRMKSKSAFLRKMILYGFVYEVDYSHIRKMNTLLGNISSNLNQITHRINSSNTVYQKDLDDIKELMEKIYRFWSVLSGLQMYSIALSTVVLIPWIFVTAIFFPLTPMF